MRPCNKYYQRHQNHRVLRGEETQLSSVFATLRATCCSHPLFIVHAMTQDAALFAAKCCATVRAYMLTTLAHSVCHLCRPEEARDVFDAGVVRQDEFRDDGAAIVRSANLLCRVGGTVYRWRHAVPALAGRLAYPLMPWRRLFRRGIRASGPADAPDSPSAPPEVRVMAEVNRLRKCNWQAV